MMEGACVCVLSHVWLLQPYGLLLSHKKEGIWLSSNKVDEPRAYYAKWSESEREKQMSYINAYMGHSSWGCKESDTTEWLIWSDSYICFYNFFLIF